MFGTGRQVISAPKGGAVASTLIATATAAAETKVWYGGETRTTVALAAGAVIAAADLTVVGTNTTGGAGGFANSSSIVIEPGTPREETLLLHTTAKESETVLGLAAQTVKFTHPVGSRVVGVVTTGALRPGSVVVLQDGTVSGIDDGNGNIIAASGTSNAATGTIDYSTGTFKLTFATGVVNTKLVTFTANSVPTGDADISDFSGQGFFKNHMGLRLNRRDVPDEIALVNLGDSEVGVYLQKSMNKGKTWVDCGTSAKLPPRGRKIITPDGGLYDQLRVRASSAASTITAAGVRTANSIEASTVEVTPLYAKIDNGQA